ncbi:MAG: hypothetical protein LIO93_12105 [Bacteroidales bacterium]|nr:hypothetical protein [Bacteroidales bacterium]
MLKKSFLGLTFLSFSFYFFGETITFNSDWYFQKLDSTVGISEIKNQGTSWESQFDVTHTQVNAELKLNKDTLLHEFNLIHRGNWEKVTLPHTPRIEELVVLYQWQGICYYKKNIYPGKRLDQ